MDLMVNRFNFSNLTREVLLCKTRQDPEPDEFMDLRSRAEAIIQEKAIEFPDVSIIPAEELQKLVHELQVQNDELRRVQLELEESRDKYQALHDSAPIGSGAIYVSDGSMRLR